ncbi:hypothetical protein KOR42_11230 [Thalassoglobus neptunius]|uniref:DUF1444 family protein n=1 Tax=Thalassoglobus neptunius TaxID=1938619 RepID=A0A5C5X3R7_9PLAN|nr:DUF1444 family protein [Thalassoglobus neptunius]TWT57757.1 hypothetical protein KOR42_11230 [Thalassoglobus neptunius]
MSNPPQHWSTLLGPANWFRMHYPPQWEVDETDGVFALRPPDSDAFLAINSIWIKEEASRQFPALGDIVDQFPKVRGVRAGADFEFEADESLSGDASLEAPSGWKQGLFASRNWRSWSMWSIRRPSLMLVITLLHEGQRDPELENLVRMILNSLEVCDEPSDPPDVFARRALKLAQSKFPLLDIDLSEDFQLRIGSSILSLANFYRAYLSHPDDFQKILLPALTTAVQVQGWGDNESSPPLEVVRDRIMPILYSESSWRKNLPGIVGNPWIAGLAVLYVIDEANAYWYVRTELRKQWNLTVDELHSMAIENLDDYFEESPMKMAVAESGEGDATMMIPDKPDTYNTVRLLSDRFLTRLRDVAQSDLAVGVPGRDLFIAVSMKSPEIVSKIRHQVELDFQRTDHPLTDKMLLVTADGVSELIGEVENDD